MGEWEFNLRHHGNGSGNGNELMGMGVNGNVASHSRISLLYFINLPQLLRHFLYDVAHFVAK